MNETGECTVKKLPMVRSLGQALELPGEALGELKLSVWGAGRALLENHGGILLWSPELLAVRNGLGSLLLYGEELRLEAMDGEALLVSGRLDRAEWKE